MPSKNQTAAAYADCFQIMDQALRVNGIRVEFPSKSRATVFRHRCYKGRAMLYNASVKSVPAGLLPSTPYDDVFIRFESDVRSDGSDCVLIFAMRSLQERPAVTDLEGNPIEAAPVVYEKLELPGITLDE